MGKKNPALAQIRNLRLQHAEVTRAIEAMENLQRLTLAVARPPDASVRTQAEFAGAGKISR